MESIEAAVKAFVQGGDTSDASLLEKVLHRDFQNIQDGFFEQKGIYVFSKEQYIELVRTRKFGGKPRSIQFVTIEQMDNIAMAKVVLESRDLRFFSSITCVYNTGAWEVISNIPKIEVKID